MTEEKTPKGENTYEKIVVAAREARRLNAIHVHGGGGGRDGKVTTRALEKTLRGEVEWRIATEEEAIEERASGAARKEDPSFGD
ncbi:MAG: hypothetical protein ABIH26_13260 [Candidatus Eisenbacteria bacterium]